MAEIQQQIKDRNVELEIYRQKYELFRHFDNLRWHIPTFTLGAGSLLLGFAAENGQPPAGWSFIIFGFLSLFSGFAIYRVRRGIHKNHIALKTIANVIGDTLIPELKEKGGASWVLFVLLIVFGLISILTGIYRYL